MRRSKVKDGLGGCGRRKTRAWTGVNDLENGRESVILGDFGSEICLLENVMLTTLIMKWGRVIDSFGLACLLLFGGVLVIVFWKGTRVGAELGGDCPVGGSPIG
jgi:hypothetical protein